MSGWDGWITFIEDCCANRSAADIKAGGASEAKWLFRLGDRDSGKDRANNHLYLNLNNNLKYFSLLTFVFYRCYVGC